MICSRRSFTSITNFFVFITSILQICPFFNNNFVAAQTLFSVWLTRLDECDELLSESHRCGALFAQLWLDAHNNDNEDEPCKFAPVDGNSMAHFRAIPAAYHTEQSLLDTTIRDVIRSLRSGKHHKRRLIVELVSDSKMGVRSLKCLILSWTIGLSFIDDTVRVPCSILSECPVNIRKSYHLMMID